MPFPAWDDIFLLKAFTVYEIQSLNTQRKIAEAGHGHERESDLESDWRFVWL